MKSISSESSASETSSTNISQSASPENLSYVQTPKKDHDTVVTENKNRGTCSCNEESIVSVKFTTSSGQTFTKGFKRTDTIRYIKTQLSNLLSVSIDQIYLQNEENIADHIELVTLEAERNNGNVELNLRTNDSYVLDRNLIYGHIPTLDIINIQRANGTELIVEIEYENGKKEWLGGYRNLITRKEYHHANTQTAMKNEVRSKLSKCLQVNLNNDQSTNTPVHKYTQTSFVPGLKDVILTARKYEPLNEINNTDLLSEDIDTKDDIWKHESTSKKENKNFVFQHRYLHSDIFHWHKLENQKLHNLNEPERRQRSIKILDRTRKFLMKVESEKRKLQKEVLEKHHERLLLKAAAPKIFTNKIGQRILIDSIETQSAHRLQVLYENYIKVQQPEERMKAIVEIKNYFISNNFEFKDYILRLFQYELNLLTEGFMCPSSLRSRIKQFIFHCTNLLMLHQPNTKRDIRDIKVTNTIIYRDILRKVQDDEIKIFKCFTSTCFRMQVPEMYYLVSEIWKNASIRSGCKELALLKMTRWNKIQEWSPDNCILLTKYEIKDHLKFDINQYDKCFTSEVKNKHLQAKIHFCDTLLQNL